MRRLNGFLIEMGHVLPEGFNRPLSHVKKVGGGHLRCLLAKKCWTIFRARSEYPRTDDMGRLMHQCSVTSLKVSAISLHLRESEASNIAIWLLTTLMYSWDISCHRRKARVGVWSSPAPYPPRRPLLKAGGQKVLLKICPFALFEFAAFRHCLGDFHFLGLMPPPWLVAIPYQAENHHCWVKV